MSENEIKDFRDSRYHSLLRSGVEEAASRLRQPGDAYDEQLLMSYLGAMVKQAREGLNISITDLATHLRVTERFILLGEIGLLDPEKFFKKIDAWGEILNVSIEKETSFFEESRRAKRS